MLDTVNSEPVEITEEAARERLAEFARASTERPSIRSLAQSWGWTKSRTERFLARVDGGTAAETREPFIVSPNCRALTVHTRRPSSDWPQSGVIGEEMGADAVLFAEQMATALYINERNELVIRQHDSSQQEDVIVLIQQENAQAFVDRICDVLGIPAFGGSRVHAAGIPAEL